jgi:hypothetical protein
MKVKGLKKMLKGMDECELRIRAYDEQGNPHLMKDFVLDVLYNPTGYNDDEEIRTAVIEPDYFLNDKTRERVDEY